VHLGQRRHYVSVYLEFGKMSLGTIWPCFLRVIPHWGHQKPLFLSATPHFSEFAKVQRLLIVASTEPLRLYCEQWLTDVV
jgi:hypothetical protein